MKKILFANTSFLPAIGGVENSIRSLMESFNLDGWECHLITRAQSEPYSGPIKNISFYQTNGFFDKKGVFRTIYTLLNREAFDIVVVRHHFLAWIISFFCRDYIYIIPGVYEHQNHREKNLSIISKLKYWAHVIIQRFAIKRCHNNVVFSDEMYRQVREFYHGTSLKKLSPGADAHRFYRRDEIVRNAVKVQNNISPETVLLLCIGRLVDVKNFGLVIRSLVHLPEHFKLMLVGDGPEKESLHALAYDLGVAERVVFFGKTDEPELFYGVADLFCLPSTYEPFGQVLLEATLSSLPVVALDPTHPGIKTATAEIYKNYHSVVHFSDEDPASYASKVKYAASYPIDEVELVRFKRDYSWDNLKNNLIKLSGE